MKYPQFDGTQNCYESGVDPYYADGEGPHTRTAKVREAKLRQLCEGCGFFDSCFEWAIHHERFGFWAGMTEAERDKYRKERGIIVELPEVLFETNYYELVARKIVKELD